MPNLDGQDDALNELVLAKQWKQALILCEKKLKKGNNDYLLVCAGPSILTKVTNNNIGPSCLLSTGQEN